MDKSIAIFTWGLDGGAFTQLPVALSKGLSQLGVKNIYVLYLEKGPKPDTKFPEGVKIIPLGVKRSILSPLAVARFIKEVKPDFLIPMPTIITVPAIMGYLLAGRKHTKLVIYQGDTLTSDIAIDHKYNLRMQILPWLTRLLYPWADGLTSVTEGVRDILIKDSIPIPKKHSTIIPNPVDVDDFYSRSLETPEHPWLKDKQTQVIVSVGRLGKRKNYPLLLQALSKVRHNVDVKLIIIGEGPQREDLEKLVQKLGLNEAVSLPGYVDNPWSHIAASDLFVMSSIDEAFCLALVEAMSCGVPVISTDAVGGGPRHILENGKYGNLVPLNDTETMAATIEKALVSSEWRSHLIDVSKHRSQAFKPEAIAKQWLSFLSEFDYESQNQSPSYQAVEKQPVAK